MKKFFLITLLMISLGSLSALTFTSKLNSNLSKSGSNSSDTLKILAVMVEFQTDHDGNTFGNGKFGSIYSKDYGNTILDPLPFNADYFSNHLEFAKNYFKKVSNGKLNIVYQILPQVITVSDSIRNYSPSPQKTNDFTNVGKLAVEVWQKAAATFPSTDFSKYNMFAIFHAGVGREAPKYSSLGTERDIPSIYLGLKTLKEIYGNNFAGISINNGKYVITNTMILPCTENHEESLVTGNILMQATINGILVGNIGSYLGLPDLNNTSTGETAISRFGLMDTDSYFTYSGIFPPEPSAWEKIYLGWVAPVTLSIGDRKVNLAAHLAALSSDTTILKIPINSTEYFLVENRQRDVKKDGIKITSKLSGQTYTFQLSKDKGKFQWYQVDTLQGVITDIDEFDWANPGNGIVIWHVDENIINANIAGNTINADQKNRGIYVEEADGTLDIGHAFYSVLSGSYEPVRASEEDMWYAGNKGKYFKNIFGPSSKPNSNSNSGANSLITIQNFSTQANKMSFNVSFGSSDINLISANILSLSQSTKLLASKGYSSSSSLFIIDGTTLSKYDKTGNLIKSIQNFSGIQPVVFDYNSSEYVVGAKGQILNLYSSASTNENNKSIDLLSTITVISVDKTSGSVPKILIGTNSGNVYSIQLDVLLTMNQFTSSAYSIYKGVTSIIGINVDNGYYTFLQSSQLKMDAAYQLSAGAVKSILTKDPNSKYESVVLQSGNIFSIYGVANSSFKIDTENTISDFSIADLFNDGQNYILVCNGNSVEAYNFSGAMAKNFPFQGLSGEKFVDVPLAIDLNKDGFVDVLGFTDKGNIYAINPITGKVLDGFPISSGSQITATPVLFGEALSTSTYKPYLAVLDKASKLYVWSLASVQGKSSWTGKYGDALNTSFVAAPSSAQQISEFFPTEKAYNWPNPVYGKETKIRYYVSEDSNVKIKIVDLSGSLVAELNNQAKGGLDNETTWDVGKIQSGIYYAHLEVTGISGKSASKNIKIAVIK